jgi:catechol O-methyltransferase
LTRIREAGGRRLTFLRWHPGSVVVADNVRFPGAPKYRAYLKAAEGKTWRTIEDDTHAEYQSVLKDLVLESVYLGEPA